MKVKIEYEYVPQFQRWLWNGYIWNKESEHWYLKIVGCCTKWGAKRALQKYKREQERIKRKKEKTEIFEI